jgi:hypothetical protein
MFLRQRLPSDLKTEGTFYSAGIVIRVQKLHDICSYPPQVNSFFREVYTIFLDRIVALLYLM